MRCPDAPRAYRTQCNIVKLGEAAPFDFFGKVRGRCGTFLGAADWGPVQTTGLEHELIPVKAVEPPKWWRALNGKHAAIFYGHIPRI